MDLNKLSEILGEKGLATDPAALEKFTVDGVTPQAVASPDSVDKAAALVKYANQAGLKLAIAGGGTFASIAGAVKAADLVLSTSRLDKIIDIDTANLTVTVQAGVKFADVADLLTGMENRCFFPVDSGLTQTADYMCSDREYKGAFIPCDPPLAQKATLGGILAASTTGPSRTRFRLLRDQVLGVRFVSPTGEIIGMGGKTVKNVSGYDLSKLMIGSLGCLGLITEITIRLLPLNEKTAGLVAVFGDFASAAAMAEKVLASRLLPVSFEIMNANAFKLGGPERFAVFPGGAWAVGFSLGGFTEEVNREIKDLTAMAFGAAEVIELNAADDKAFWAALADETLSQATFKFKANYKLAAYGEVAGAFAKAGQGAGICISPACGVAHVYCPDGDQGAANALGQALRGAATANGGGLLLEKAPLGFKQGFDAYGPARNDFPLMMNIKKQVDPNGVFNHGRFVGGL